MTAWIVLLVLVALFTLLVRRGRTSEPTLPRGYDRERQLAELRAMTAASTRGLLP
jgi:hypothetical protein